MKYIGYTAKARFKVVQHNQFCKKGIYAPGHDKYLPLQTEISDTNEMRVVYKTHNFCPKAKYAFFGTCRRAII